MEWFCSRKGNGLMPVRDLLMSAAGASSGPVTYVDDVFSTYLYTGTSATQSINNGIDLAGKGGLVWIKDRTNSSSDNVLFDTVRGANNYISSDSTVRQNAFGTPTDALTSFNSNGFSLGADATIAWENVSPDNYASWSFRKQPKFFNIVQYTGTGSVQAINHSLGSTPGCIMIKETSATNNWAVYHKCLNGGTTPQNYYTVLNTTAAQVSSSAWWNNTAPTSTQFTVGTNATVNASGQTYIAYIFADQAGGFGTAGTDNVISCDSFTTDGSGNATVNLGYEPQYVLLKSTTNNENWKVFDVMRGWGQKIDQELNPNIANAENSNSTLINAGQQFFPTATGFQTVAGFLTAGATYIYMAIRRPMKVPTTGTSVFSPNVYTPASPQTVTTNFPVDLTFFSQNSKTISPYTKVIDRLRGDSQTYAVILNTPLTLAESVNGSNGIGLDNNTAIVDNFSNTVQGITDSMTYWNFARRPNFYDEVCYTGTGSATTQAHNLGVAPELMIVKERSAGNNWWIYHSATGNTNYSVLNTTAIPVTSSTAWNNTTPTASVFSIGTGTPVNTSGATYVAYLFATCAGVSKVGTYTGNATGQSIACGFGSGGARFVLIKRTDSTGDWYVFDSANGLTSSSSPYLTLNTTNAQVTGNNGVYASSGGFTLGATALLTTNIATATYIFLAIS